MNFCQHSSKIIDYVLGLLAENDRTEFEEHLQTCTVCQRELTIETTVEKILSVELEPGYIESKVLARVKLRQAQSMRSLWLYSLRMIVYGVVAGVIGLILTSFILRFPFAKYLDYFDIGKYVGSLSGLPGQVMASTSSVFLIIGAGYILIILSSLYSFTRIRK